LQCTKLTFEKSYSLKKIFRRSGKTVVYDEDKCSCYQVECNLDKDCPKVM